MRYINSSHQICPYNMSVQMKWNIYRLHTGYHLLFISLRCSMIFSSMERASSRRFVSGIPRYAPCHLNRSAPGSVALMQAG